MNDLTVFELNPDHFEVALPLFAGATFDRVHVAAVFEKRQPGRIFVDDPVAPASALLCRTYEYYLTGEVTPGLVFFLDDAPVETCIFNIIHDLATARLQQTTAFYGLVPLNPAWDSALQDMYGGRLEIIGRRTFRFDPLKTEHARGWNRRLPGGFTVHPIDAELARRIDNEAGELIGLFWGGYARFGAHGFGSCAMTGNEVAAVAYTVAVSSEEANFGVETVARFRRLGLATVVSQACVAQALDRGLTPTWDCDLPNQPSAALALKAGFSEYPSFAEFAFPDRQGPSLSTGIWVAEPIETGTRWRRLAG